MKASDPLAIRALAHPIRLDLLDLLTEAGPSTAARCGRELGLSQASCSFHLRQLAKYGYIEEGEPGSDRRERVWRLVARYTASDARTPPALAGRLSRLVVDREAERFREYLGRVDQETSEWREAVGGHATAIQVTVAEAAGIRRAWAELMAPFVERSVAAGYEPDPDRRTVHYLMTAIPQARPQQEEE